MSYQTAGFHSVRQSVSQSVREEAQGRQHWGIFRDHPEMIPDGNIAVRQQVTRKMNKQSGVKIEKIFFFFSVSLVVTGGTAGSHFCDGFL